VDFEISRVDVAPDTDMAPPRLEEQLENRESDILTAVDLTETNAAPAPVLYKL
jgi:hypothetical protein